MTQVDARKATIAGAGALAVVKDVNEIYATRGQRVVRLDLRQARPAQAELAALLVGPTGNLRAPTLRVGECVDYVARHYPNPLPRNEVLARFGLDKLARRQTGGLSGGQQRRLAVALAFVGRPRLVLLDEPTTGLDVEIRHVLWDAIRDFHAEGGTVLLTSHYLDEVEALAQRVVVIDNARILADDSVDAIRALVGVHRVSLTAATLPPLPNVVATSKSDGRIDVLTTDSDELVRALVRSGVAFRDLTTRPTTLEEAFLAILEQARAR